MRRMLVVTAVVCIAFHVAYLGLWLFGGFESPHAVYASLYGFMSFLAAQAATE